MSPVWPIKKKKKGVVMSSVSAINPAVANLLQTLSKVNSPALSSSTVVSALENASPGDLVPLDAAANQLNAVDELLGSTAGSSSSSGINTNGILASLELPLTDSVDSVLKSLSSATNNQGSSSASSTALPGNQLTAANLENAEAAGLLNAGEGSSLSSPLDLIG